MKKQLTKICIPIVIALIASSLYTLPTTYAEQTPTQEQVLAQQQSLAFIENALPVDLSKYSLNVTKQSTTETADGAALHIVRYYLNSEDSTVEVICDIQNNVLRSCQVYEETGALVSNRQYANLDDAVKSFLERYQTYSKLDSTNLIAMIDKVDITTNSTTTIGNAKLTVTNVFWAGKDLTSFVWAHTVNGVDYTSLQLGFQKNGKLDTLYDNRAIYTIGDTSINISKEQAIEIALKNLSTYSYKMSDKSTVSDFNVVEENIVAELTASPINSELRPYWRIKMPLNQTYPGSVQGIQTFIWANTGEIISYSNIAFGGAYYGDNSELEASPSSETTQNSSTAPDTSFVITIASAIGLIIGSIAIIKRKKR